MRLLRVDRGCTRSRRVATTRAVHHTRKLFQQAAAAPFLHGRSGGCFLFTYRSRDRQNSPAGNRAVGALPAGSPIGPCPPNKLERRVPGLARLPQRFYYRREEDRDDEYDDREEKGDRDDPPCVLLDDDR